MNAAYSHVRAMLQANAVIPRVIQTKQNKKRKNPMRNLEKKKTGWRKTFVLQFGVELAVALECFTF